MDTFLQFCMFIFALAPYHLMLTAYPVSNQSHVSLLDPLTNLGHISMNIVENIAQAQDEGVDMAKLSDFVMALAEATAVLKNPQIPQLDDVKDDMTQLRGFVTGQTAELSEYSEALSQELQLTTTKLSQLEAKLNRTMEGFLLFKEETEHIQEPVAFTASATNNQVFSTSTVVKFDKVLLNIGNHYDPAVSLFICPVTGLYLVSVKVDEYSTNGFYLEVLVADVRIFYLNEGSGSSSYGSSAGSAITECQMRSKIWVQSTGSGKIYAHSEANIFSVLLVKRMT